MKLSDIKRFAYLKNIKRTSEQDAEYSKLLQQVKQDEISEDHIKIVVGWN
jgi:hypothetical protein